MPDLQIAADSGDSAVTVLIAAGGTGGHVFPGLAVAENLREKNDSVIWLGTPTGIEARVVPASDIPIQFINVLGVRGKKVLDWLKAPWLMLFAVFAAIRLIRQYQVSVVLGMGGYVSVAAGIAAILLRKPLVLQEQNAVAGTANKLLAPFARTIFTGFDSVFAERRNAQWSGNPLRKAFVDGLSKRRSNDESHFNIFIVGGSLGAHALNSVLPKAIELLRNTLADEQLIQVLHQTGKAELESVRNAYQQIGLQAEVCEFIEDMPAAYSRADLVVARAGALTVSEICAVGVAAIFIPYPYAIDDHQAKNAMTLVEAGAALSIPQSQLSAELLAEKLMTLFDDVGVLRDMADKASQLARLDATNNVATACRELAYG